MVTSLLILIIFVLFSLFIFRLQQQKIRLSRQVLFGLLIGVIFGFVLQWTLGHQNAGMAKAMEWLDIVGGGYVHLLKMVMIPLVTVSIMSAVARLEHAQSLGKISISILAILMITVSIAAFLGVASVHIFGLSAANLINHDNMDALNASLQGHVSEVKGLTIPQMLLEVIPTNIVSDLAGSRSVSVIGVVIFSAFSGVAALKLRQEKPEIGDKILSFIEMAQHWVMRLVKMVINLTPYGVMALIIKVMVHYNPKDLLNLVGFIVACYAAIIAMFIIHGLILVLSGTNPVRYLKTVWPLLTFAFVSRSSAASIPLNIETQMKLGNSEAVANFSSSFGATIGQNACAGIYPAMIVAMTAPLMGVDPFSLHFLLMLLPIIALGSLGVAGVGGGGTFASLIVLSALNFPVALVALMIAIEPLVDMGRTALNVNGAVVAGTLTSKLLGEQVATEAPVEELAEL
ncbi:cation:dicarboxylate symporter family transporter [Dongshaea marina]|uniref:cation:dicarboxylate symporter family transporter n=1 Tax=Dongshaea marina TaxID=2047966 RepID=UPI0018FF2489|nr:cation:dicarboxylase symporter family transporter [Dongshaea marina]